MATSPAWTEDRVQTLTRLWRDGLSASQIARALAGGVTRNAVIGKVHRLGLSGRARQRVRAATGAVVRVLIDSTDGERVWTTVGVDSNVIEASWQALADSLLFGLLHAAG